MATLSTSNPTLLDLAKAQDPDGQIATVVEILDETNEILADMSWMEGNLPTGHRTTIRAGLPTPTWRKLNYGVQPNKGTMVQVTDECGMLEAYAEVDKALADLNNNTSAFRLQEDRAHLEGMNQEMAETLFYGNSGTEPEAFTGLSPRFNSLSADNAENILVGGGAGSDNASIWLVVWGPNTVHGIVPKGSQAGVQVTDKGIMTINDAPAGNMGGASRGRMEAYVTHYRWDAGLTVRDWRYLVRIPNIDKSLLSVRFNNGQFVAADGTTAQGAHLPNLMFQAIRRVPNLSFGRAAFYMSRDIMTTLFQQASASTNQSTLMVENVGGKVLESFMGIPLRRVDALAADEALVS